MSEQAPDLGRLQELVSDLTQSMTGGTEEEEENVNDSEEEEDEGVEPVSPGLMRLIPDGADESDTLGSQVKKFLVFAARLSAPDHTTLPSNITGMILEMLKQIRHMAVRYNDNDDGVNDNEYFNVARVLYSTPGVMTFFKLLLVHTSDEDLKEQVLWLISDVCAVTDSRRCTTPQTPDQLHDDLVPHITDLVGPPAPLIVRINAGWCIANIIGEGNVETSRRILNIPSLVLNMCEIVANSNYWVEGSIWTLRSLVNNTAASCPSRSITIVRACLRICKNNSARIRHMQTVAEIETAQHDYYSVLPDVQKILKAVFASDDDVVTEVIKAVPDLVSTAASMCRTYSSMGGRRPAYCTVQACMGADVLARAACVSDAATTMILFVGGCSALDETVQAAAQRTEPGDNTLVRNCYWALSNLAAGSKEHASAVHRRLKNGSTLNIVAAEIVELSAVANARARCATDLLVNLHSHGLDCWDSEFGGSDQPLTDAEAADAIFVPACDALVAVTDSVQLPTAEDVFHSESIALSTVQAKAAVSYMCLLRMYKNRFPGRLHRRLARKTNLKVGLQKLEAFCTHAPVRRSAKTLLSELVM